MSKFKKILIVFLIASVLGTLLVSQCTKETTTYELPSYSSMLYISDYSHVFSEQTEQFIAEQARILDEKTGVQVAVAAVPSTNNQSIEEFSLALAREWGIGDAEKDTGVLLLFTTQAEDPHVRMEIGYGMEGCLNDAKCGRILDDYCVEPMHDGAWNRAVMQTWVETAKVIYAEYGIDAPEALTLPLDVAEEPGENTSADADMPEPVVTIDDSPFLERIATNFLIFWILALPAGAFIVVFIRSIMGGGGSSGGGRYRSSGGSSGGGSSGGGSFGGGGFGGGGTTR